MQKRLSRDHMLISLIFLSFTFNMCEHLTPPSEGYRSTPDSTSQNFAWNTFVFGEGDPSYATDVFIISESDIWVTGEISSIDSAGMAADPYNVLHWDGQFWQKERVPVRDFGGTNTRPYPLRSVFAFSSTDVWVNAGAALIHWNGQKWEEKAFFLTSLSDSTYGPINKMWGATNSRLFCVGNKGMIVRYSGGGNWSKISSGTATSVNDAWGIVSEVGAEEIYCAVSDFFSPADKRILRITGLNGVDSIEWGLSKNIYSVWTFDGKTMYACGEGIFENSKGIWDEIKIGLNSNLNSIRGNKNNDIIIAGGFGIITHYNGVRWKIFNQPSEASFYAVSMKDRIVCAVGRKGSQAIVTVGARN